MSMYYFTFGFGHAHAVGGVTYDKDCVVAVEAEDSTAAREHMFATFGRKWAFQYDELPEMSYFPRGVLRLP
jgi:hypothetical protein